MRALKSGPRVRAGGKGRLRSAFQEFLFVSIFRVFLADGSLCFVPMSSLPIIAVLYTEVYGLESFSISQAGMCACMCACAHDMHVRICAGRSTASPSCPSCYGWPLRGRAVMRRAGFPKTRREGDLVVRAWCQARQTKTHVCTSDERKGVSIHTRASRVSRYARIAPFERARSLLGGGSWGGRPGR